MSWLSNWVAITLTTADLVWKSGETFFAGAEILSSSLNLNTLLKFRIFPNVPRSLRRTLRFIQIVASYQEGSWLLHIIQNNPDHWILSILLYLIRINASHPECCILSKTKLDCCILSRQDVASFPNHVLLAPFGPNLQLLLVGPVDGQIYSQY